MKPQKIEKVANGSETSRGLNVDLADADLATPRAKSLPAPAFKVILGLVALSLLLHLVSLVNLGWVAGRLRGTDMVLQKPQPLRIQVKTIKKEPKADEDEDESSKLSETKQTPTEKPTVPSRLGPQDHKTDKETKVAITKPQPKGADAGNPGDVAPQQTAAPQNQKKPQTAEKKPSIDPSNRRISTGGSLSFGPPERKPRNTYESLLPMGSKDLTGEVKAGYQEYIDDDVAVGDRVDLNTTNYRYIGYFTNVRKAFELVWVYPAEAVRRGMEGEVRIEFRIDRDGRVSRIKILRSSGFEILDKATVETLKIASPLPPLPPGLGKDKLVVTAAFRYVLYSFAGGH